VWLAGTDQKVCENIWSLLDKVLMLLFLGRNHN
jgi:hypothetical protein